MNAHVFVPPSKKLIDAWGRLGNDGWEWNTLQQYFSKSYTSPSISSAEDLGVNEWESINDLAKGPVQASFSGNASHPIRKAWHESFKALGHVAETGPFLGISTGAFTCLSSIDPATRARSFAAFTYYQAVQDRGNLKLLTGAVVEKILFDEARPFPRAKGVRYSHENVTHEILAKKEVILAAGALQSPKILELSGIGDKTLLENHAINPVKDLPAVGENLQDDLLCSIGFEAANEVDTLDALVRQEPEVIGPAMAEYAANQTGILSSVGVYTYAYLPILEQSGKQSVEQLLKQKQPPNGSLPSEARARAYYKIAEQGLVDDNTPSGAYLSILAQHNAPAPVQGEYISVGVILSQPLSRGSVHIQSADIGTAPTLDPRYLSSPIDLEVMAHHLRYIEIIATTKPFKELLKKPLQYRDPASQFDDVEAAKEYIRSKVISMWHLSGTCAMLPEEKGGVVDSTLKVHGIEGLRVVDSSAIPIISTANLQSTVYAFAERAADIIKHEHGMN